MLDVETSEELIYKIIVSAEADPGKAKISNESPVGRALIGKTVNSEVEVIVPDGIIKMKILDIKK